MSPPPPVPEGSKAKVTLTGTPATLLLTLAVRVQDLHNPDPILGDKWAEYVAEQIDYDYSTINTNPTMRDAICLRTRYLDQWTGDFLAAHADERVTVLNIACGLDARAHRVEWGPNVRWIDVDLPDVVELRRRLLPEPGGDYALVAGSALDDALLGSVPDDRPTAVVVEGLLIYLQEPQAHDLIRRLCSRFPSGELMFDIMSPVAITLQRWRDRLLPGSWMQKQGTGFTWGTDPAAIERLHDGLKLETNVPWYKTEGIKNPSPGHKLWEFVAMVPLLPSLTGYNLRYSF